MNPAPVMELAPFCDRESGNTAGGSLILRLSRESIFRALAAGLTGEEVMARLERHAGALPGNVRTQVQSWCAQVRQVSLRPALLIRCPDAATADRVKAALGKSVDRLGETTLAFLNEKMTAAERQKLQGQGIIVQMSAEGRKKKRR